MTTSQQVAKSLPYLRRYARALTGSQTSGDNFVKATLEAIIAEPEMLEADPRPRVALYKAFQRIYDSAHIEVEGDGEGDNLERAAQRRLSTIAPACRQAMLLTTLEGFSPDEAGAIMSRSEDELAELVDEAVAEIERQTATTVLIIEDEPLISMQLEQLVTQLGHQVSGTAATHKEALAAVAEARPGIVLADIQLGDGSSGIDAVYDILEQFSVPVIFVTAFPERLLTGERPEPTYLITKPFQEETVRAAISQALFLGTTESRKIAA
ncbi:response regulator [Tardibacter chloracetimidivorans]|uniref:Response regulator n=1 Tax=Tardibacter chloracetimidivorans TaxID=1921510 RepID=A0A1L3ZT75_9SPHN|nr:response regulator [Tardibacter chloracetimidivorans]API58800.1 response regulator [Tardibacter chloracetimidivorans]